MKKFNLTDENRHIMNAILRDNQIGIKGIKDLCKVKGKKVSLKKKINRKEFDRFCLHFLKDTDNSTVRTIGYLDELCLEAIEFLHKAKTKKQNYDCYLWQQKNCPEYILKTIVKEDVFCYTDRSLEKIADYNFLMKYCGPDSTPRFRAAILKNPHCTKAHFDMIVEQASTSVFITEDIIEHKFATPETYHKVLSVTSYCSSTVGKKEDILPETIQLIIDSNGEVVSNWKYAKGSLLINPAVNDDFKKEIINQGKESYTSQFEDRDKLNEVVINLAA